MSYTRPLGWNEGETMFACSICGFPFRFPSELVYADDRLFYCTRHCWLGETVSGHFRKLPHLHPRRDEQRPPVMGGMPSWWE